MHIDKFKDTHEDRYTDETGCSYSNAIEYYQLNLGGCMCGNADRNLAYIRDGLKFISEKKRHDEDWKQFVVRLEIEAVKIFGSEEARYFFYYFCDHNELIEHGTCVPGWLTKKGIEYLEDLIEILSDTEEDS